MGPSKSKHSSSPGKGGKVTLQVPPPGTKQGASQKPEQVQQTENPPKVDTPEVPILSPSSSTKRSGILDERIVSQSDDSSASYRPSESPSNHQGSSIDRTNDSETQRQANSSAYRAGFGRIGTMVDQLLLNQSSEQPGDHGLYKQFWRHSGQPGPQC
jgi:hypothetical protein